MYIFYVPFMFLIHFYLARTMFMWTTTYDFYTFKILARKLKQLLLKFANSVSDVKII